MNSRDKSFEDLIQKDRARNVSKPWSGTLLDYLDLVKQDPDIPKLAHARIYQMLIGDGGQDLAEINDPRMRHLFGDQHIREYEFFKHDFFGIEKVIDQIVRYFHAASLSGEESRQVLYLMGPVGAGKSSLAERLKQAVEQAGTFYAIDGCPVHEEPLHLIPKHLRKEFAKMLDVHIEGELCPLCRYRLEHEFDGHFEKFPVVTRSFSINERRGIAVVPPVDPNNQDTSVLIGSEDISKLDKYSEGDPRVLDLKGAFNAGNRGIVEFIEVFKNATEYLHTIITATQEKFIPAPGRHGTIYVDTVIVAHSNEAEWQKFKADNTNEAILDRIVMIKVPYNLRLSEEIRIYEKILKSSGFKAHIAPHTLEIAAMFAILTRLEPSPKCDPLTKLRLYNGETVVEKGRTKKVDLAELRDEVKGEGFSGISTRFIMKALDSSLSRSPQGITPIHIRETLIRMVKDSELADDVKKHYLMLLQDLIHKAYLELLEKEITTAFVYAYEEQAETLFQNYLDHAEAYVNKGKVRVDNTGEELHPDEAFLKSIEEQIAIVGAAADGFRQEVISYLWAATRHNEKVSYRSYEPLKEAIEKKLTNSVRDLTRIITLSRTRDEEQKEKYEALVHNLLEKGYTEFSADVILKYAANNLWKD